MTASVTQSVCVLGVEWGGGGVCVSGVRWDGDCVLGVGWDMVHTCIGSEVSCSVCVQALSLSVQKNTSKK